MFPSLGFLQVYIQIITYKYLTWSLMKFCVQVTLGSFSIFFFPFLFPRVKLFMYEWWPEIFLLLFPKLLSPFLPSIPPLSPHPSFHSFTCYSSFKKSHIRSDLDFVHWKKTPLDRWLADFFRYLSCFLWRCCPPPTQYPSQELANNLFWKEPVFSHRLFLSSHGN